MKRIGIIVLAGTLALTACQSRQTTEISDPDKLSTSEINRTTDIVSTYDTDEIGQSGEQGSEAFTGQAPAIPTGEALPKTEEAQPEQDREPPAFHVKQVVMAAVDEYFRDWETRADGSRITDYVFTIDDEMLIMHDGNEFIACAGFSVLPEQYEWTSWGAYPEPDEDGRITDSRFFTIRREGAEYHVTDAGTGAFHRPYSDLVAGIAAGEKPNEFDLDWFCPAEVAEYVLTERLEKSKQDAQHPISDFSFEVYSDTVVSEGNGAFSFYATIRVLPANTENENISYWTGANGVTLDDGRVESYLCYTLERVDGLFKITGTGTGSVSTPYLSDEWNMWWS